MVPVLPTPEANDEILRVMAADCCRRFVETVVGGEEGTDHSWGHQRSGTHDDSNQRKPEICFRRLMLRRARHDNQLQETPRQLRGNGHPLWLWDGIRRARRLHHRMRRIRIGRLRCRRSTAARYERQAAR